MSGGYLIPIVLTSDFTGQQRRKKRSAPWRLEHGGRERVQEEESGCMDNITLTTSQRGLIITVYSDSAWDLGGGLLKANESVLTAYPGWP